MAAVASLVAGAVGSRAAGQAPPSGDGSHDQAIVLIRSLNSLRASRGSGFVVGDGSWVLTASHVVAADLGKGRRASDQTVLVYTAWTGRPVEARVAAVDGVADVALVRLPTVGHPALKLEGLELREADALRTALENRPLRLFGFPLSYGEDTVASLARPEHNDTRLSEIARRDQTSLCVLGECPGAQPGWSGGPIVAMDRGAVVGVFHSLYRKPGAEKGNPAGSPVGYLAEVLKQAPTLTPQLLTQPPPPTLARPSGAGEQMAREMRSLSWAAGGFYKKAEEEQRGILKAAPGDRFAQVELGRLLLAQKRFEEALTVLKAAAEAAPQSILAHLTLARAYHMNYDPDGALKALKTVQTLSPGEVEPILLRAEVLESNEKPDQAEAALRAAVEQYPLHPALAQRLGSLLLRRKKDEEGLKQIARAVELSSTDPGLGSVLIACGRSQELARKVREAETTYRTLVRADPNSGEGRFALATLLFRLQRADEAQFEINQAFKLELSEQLLTAFRDLQARLNQM